MWNVTEATILQLLYLYFLLGGTTLEMTLL